MKNIILAKFGHNLRMLRSAAGLSQEELAYRCSMHRTYLGGIERGERNLTLVNIISLAQGLGCSIEALFSGINISSSTVDEED